MFRVTKEAVCECVDKFSSTIFKIAFYKTLNQQDAEDITQEVFLELVQRQSFQNENHLRFWLIRVCINKCINLLKSAERNRTMPLEKVAKTLFSFDETGYEVMEAFSSLKSIDRDIIYLTYYEGYSAREVASLMARRKMRLTQG